MEVSIIIIGKNASLTIAACIESIQYSIKKAGAKILLSEILYIDSKSTDSTLEIVDSYREIKIIEILKSSFYSAALGRFIGKRNAKFSNILFLDSDMVLDENWFLRSDILFAKYGAIVGQWNEIVYRDNKVVSKTANFKAVLKEGPIEKPCGFLQLNIESLNCTPNFHPLVINNEEMDFYAQFISSKKIYQIPIPAFEHHNYNVGRKNRLHNYLKINGKTGLYTSGYYALKNGYLKQYYSLQKDKINSLLFGFIFLLTIISLNFYIITSSFLIYLLVSRFKLSRIIETLIAPYKILGTILIISRKQIVVYKWKGRDHSIKIS